MTFEQPPEAFVLVDNLTYIKICLCLLDHSFLKFPEVSRPLSNLQKHLFLFTYIKIGLYLLEHSFLKFPEVSRPSSNLQKHLFWYPSGEHQVVNFIFFVSPYVGLIFLIFLFFDSFFLRFFFIFFVAASSGFATAWMKVVNKKADKVT